MLNKEYSSLFLDQTKDLIWMVDADLLLTYANQAYLILMKQATGKEKKLNEPILVEGFGEGYIEKWKAYYERGLNGEQFEIEEHFFNPNTNQFEYSEISFKPIADENGVIVNLACQSRDITSFIQSNAEAEILLDASLDVICSIDEQGNFTKVSAACKELWGYEKQELIGKAYISFVIEEDIEKTNLVAADIIAGKSFTTFENRYKRKDGGIAFNLWSARWDPKTQIMFCVARDGREKIKKEELLIASENRFKALVQEGSDLIGILDEAGLYTYVSPTSKGILGIEPEEFIGKSPFEYIHPEDAEKTLNSLGKIATESRVEVKPFRFQNKIGEWRWIETVLTNMLDNPSVKGIVANSRDITETKNIFNKIAANEQFNRTVLESSPDCLKILDNEGRLLYMNFNGLCQMEIDDFSAVKNKQWGLLWGLENEALVRASLEKALTGETVQFTAFCPTAKGTPKWWDVMVSPVIKAGEPIEKIVSVSRDITAKKEEEQRLKLLESVITNANDAILITEAEPFDEPGPRIIYVNEAFTKMTGYTPEEVIGKSPRILQGPKSDKAELARLGKALRNWEPCEITTINYKKNGEEFWVNFSISPVADKKGWYTHWISIERDVTEQKIKEREKELLTDISLNFNRENDFFNACKGLCQTIGVFGAFDWVELFTVNIERSKVQYSGHFLHDPSDEVFYAETQGYQSFEMGNGLPGKVWQKKNQVLWSVLDKTKDYVRKEAAKKINLKSAFGIPLINENEVIAVLVVGSKKGADSLKKYAGLFANFHEFIGLEIYRKKLENDLNHLYQSIPDIVCVADFQGLFLKMNPSGCHLLGYTEEEIIYHSFDEFVFPADKDISAQEVAKLGKGQSVFSFENRYVQKNGELCWLSWTCNADMEEGLIYATAKNITTEKKLHELNNVTSNMARIGSWEVDLHKNKIFWSEMVHQLHETDPQNYEPDLTKGINFYREDFRPMVTEAVNQCIQLGTPFDFEAVIVTANKNELWVRAIGNAELLNGECIRIYGSIQDIHERKKANEEITISEEKRRLIMNGALDAIITIDTNETISFWNPQAEVIFGWKAEEVMGKPLSEMIIPEQFRKYHLEGLKNYLKTGEGKALNVLLELSAIRKNGEEFPIELTVLPIKQGGEEFFCAFIRDITQRKNAESKLIENENYLRTILDNEPECVKVLNRKGELLSMNPAGLAMIEANNEQQVLGHRMMDLVNIEYQLGFNRLSKEVFKGNAGSFEFEITGLKGGRRWLETHAVPLKDTTGKVVNLLGVTRDITEQKKAEEKLWNAFIEKTSILERITEAFVSLDANWCYTYMNKQAGEIFNKDPEKMIGKHIWIEFPEGLNQPFHLAYEKAMATQEYVHVEEYYKPYDLWFENHIYPSPDGISIFFRNITERKRSEEKLIESEQKYRQLSLQLQLQQIHLTSAQEVAKLGSWETDLSNLKLTWSDETYRIFGTDRESFETTHESFLNYVHPDDREKVNKALIDSTQATDPTQHSIEHRIITASGEVKVVEEQWKVTFGDKGEPLMAIGSCQDISERKKAEKELVEERRLLRAIIDNIPVNVYVKDSSFKKILSNKTDVQFAGFQDEKSVLGKTDFEIFNNITSQISCEQDFQVIQSKESIIGLETPLVKNDGTESWLLVSKIPLLNEKEEVTGLVGVSVDITERRKSQQLLLESERTLSSILNSLDEVVWAISLPDSKLVLISNSFDKVFGKSSKIRERKFLLWKEVILPEDKWIGERIEKEVIAQGQSNGIFRINDALGNIKWLENTVKIIRNEQDEPVMIIGTSTDITEKKNAEDALTSAQELTEVANRSKAELELRALQMQMNPHFIFNALNSIQSYILNQDTLTANLYLTKFSRLIRLFLDSSRSKFIPLSEEINLLTLYIEVERIRFDNKFEFEILFEGHVNKNIEIPTMILQPFIENAINHGLRYKQQKGLLSIRFREEQNYLICTIEDDGVGRKNSEILKDKPIEGYKSQGLKITAERLVTYNRINDANIVFSIRDRIEHPNSPSDDIGTFIEIRFPEI